jgi:hypothetical protein
LRSALTATAKLLSGFINTTSDANTAVALRAVNLHIADSDRHLNRQSPALRALWMTLSHMAIDAIHAFNDNSSPAFNQAKHSTRLLCAVITRTHHNHVTLQNSHHVPLRCKAAFACESIEVIKQLPEPS